MNFLELAKKRRSYREYDQRPVPKETILRCLEAARVAPSACNSQPWHFIVIETKELKEKLADKAFSSIYFINAFARNAPVLVAVVRGKSKPAADLAGQARGIEYNLIDLGIACEHFVLQAQEEGLGTCWIGWFNEKGVKEVLAISKDKKVDIIISLGYPKKALLLEKETKTLEEISEFR